MNKHIDIIRTNTDDMVILDECNLLEQQLKQKQDMINEYATRINKIIKEINDYEEDYYEEPSVIVNKRDRKEKWSFEEYQANILQIANGDYKKYENENKINKAIEYINDWLEAINNDDIIIAMSNLENILKGENNE